MPGAGFGGRAHLRRRGYRTRRPNTPGLSCATASLRRIACWVHEPPCRDKDIPGTGLGVGGGVRGPRADDHGVMALSGPSTVQTLRAGDPACHSVAISEPIVVTLSPEHRSRTLRRHRTFAQWRVSSPTQVSSRQPASARRAGDAGPQRTILQPRCRLNLWPPSASPMAERRAAMSRKKPDGGHRLSAAGPPTTQAFAPAPDVQLDRSRVPSRTEDRCRRGPNPVGDSRRNSLPGQPFPSPRTAVEYAPRSPFR